MKTMPTTDPRVDAYIAKAPAFAQPILSEARARVHEAVPQIEETIKWNVPFFLYGGELLASMAAFKKHTKVGVWSDMKPKFVDVTSVGELPPASAFAALVKDAAKRIGGAAPAKKTTPAKRAAPAKKAVSAKKATAKPATKPRAKTAPKAR